MPWLTTLIFLNMVACAFMDKQPDPADPYNIQVEFAGWTPSAEQEIELDDAIAVWESALLEGFQEIQLDTTQADIDENPLAIHCQPSQTVVDDLLLWFTIDAELNGQTLAVGKVCHVDGGRTGLPRTGVIRLSEELAAGDLYADSLAEVLAHEIGHVIVYTNRVWNLDSDGDYESDWELIPGYEGDCPADSEFVYEGAAGVAAWHEMGGEGGVPMEPGDTSSPESGCTHLKENVFPAALMSAYLSDDTALGLTSVSIGMLEDGGYVADPDQAIEIEVNVTDEWTPFGK